jgi:hypothetical protein
MGKEGEEKVEGEVRDNGGWEGHRQDGVVVGVGGHQREKGEYLLMCVVSESQASNIFVVIITSSSGMYSEFQVACHGHIHACTEAM